MVDLSKAKKKKKKRKTVVLSCRIDEIYKKKLDELDVPFSAFVNEAFKETFPNLLKEEKNNEN